MIIQNKDSEMDSINDEDTVEEESNGKYIFSTFCF
jgi:hypothetical protein